MEMQRSQNIPEQFRKRTKLEDLPSQFKTFYKATLIKAVWYRCVNRQIHGIAQSSETYLYTIYGQLIFI